MTSRPYDVAVVGAGIIGLATALALQERHPALRLCVVDKEATVGAHQTGHNSGVVHRGVYYAPGSLKARLCVEGAERLLAYCDERGIPYASPGKLIVAAGASEEARLDELMRRGTLNGVPDLRLVSAGELAEIEPSIVGTRALHSPHTAIVDFGLVADAYAQDVIAGGGELRLGCRVRALHRDGTGLVLETDGEPLRARHAVTCAGLQSDLIAAGAGSPASRDLRIIPFRGDYYRLRPEVADRIRGLVYPVPDPRFPFLGVHFTRRIDGSVLAGPNAVLALAREGYGRFDASARDIAGMLRFAGFWRMGARYWRTGLAEAWRDYHKPAFVRALRRFMPEIASRDLVEPSSGVRAQAVRSDGTLVDDFVVDVSPAAIHVLNAPSPAATSALAIARLIADRAESAFALGA